MTTINQAAARRNLQLSVPSRNLQLSVPSRNLQLSVPSGNLQLSVLSRNLQLSVPSRNLQLSVPSRTPAEALMRLYAEQDHNTNSIDVRHEHRNHEHRYPRSM